MRALERERRQEGSPGRAAASTPCQRERPGLDPGRGERRIAAGLLLLALILFLAHLAPRLNAPFGDSHDGRNAGVWAAGARSLREHGPVASRLGAVTPENGTYANHPPLLYLETAATRLFGSSPAATRAPAWLGSLVALGLVAVLLRDRGLRPVAVGAGVAVVAVTPMFLTFGAMLDTPVASLPFGVGLLVVWQRARSRDPVPALAIFTVAALAVLAGWQSLLVAAVAAACCLAALLRGDRPRGAAALVAGAALGAGLLLAWLLWVGGGSVDFLLGQFGYRAALRPSSAVSASLGDFLSAQRTSLGSLFGWWLLPIAAVGIGLAVADRRTRALAAAAVVVTVPYTLVFRTGAVAHDYWNYWWLLPVALGVATCADRTARRLAARSASPLGFPAAVAAVVVLLATGVAVRPPAEEKARRRGLAAGRLAAHAPLGPLQGTAWYAGDITGEPVAWLSLATRRPAAFVPEAAVPAMVRSHPDDLVLFAQATCVPSGVAVSYSWRTAADLLARPHVPWDCRG